VKPKTSDLTKREARALSASRFPRFVPSPETGETETSTKTEETGVEPGSVVAASPYAHNFVDELADRYQRQGAVQEGTPGSETGSAPVGPSTTTAGTGSRVRVSWASDPSRTRRLRASKACSSPNPGAGNRFSPPVARRATRGCSFGHRGSTRDRRRSC